MVELSPGWATDLAVLRHGGSSVEDRGSHLVVRSPDNPVFHWGNCLFVTDGDAVDDAARWVRTFEAEFPQATWVSIGLIRMPDDVRAWADQDVELELDEVLTTTTLPLRRPLAEGYTVHRLDGEDWEQSVRLGLAENARTGDYDPRGHEEFLRARNRTRRSLSDRDVGAFFGAFTDGLLVAELGIVRCGSTARYQSVGTDAPHRCRGLASHLLGVAASWSAEQGCDRWVIVTESTNAAGRVYRGVGFTPDTPNAQAYRKGARTAGSGP